MTWARAAIAATVVPAQPCSVNSAAAAAAMRCLVWAACSPGPPLHVHPGTDELFLIQDGIMLLHADGRTHRLAAGDAAFVPRGTAHTFASSPDGPVRFLTVHTPGGFEQMHRDVCRAEREAGRAFGPAEIMPIAARHDWTFAGPPLLPSGGAGPGPAAAGRPGGRLGPGRHAQGPD